MTARRFEHASVGHTRPPAPRRRRLWLATVAAAGALTVTTASARAQTTVPHPFSSLVAPARPPLESFPTAGQDPPPAEVIGDPVPDSACGGWYLPSNYGDRWRANSTWWEYSCTRLSPVCSGACNADWIPSVWQDSYWDGSRPVFYGQYYGDYYALAWCYQVCEWWWDEPSDRWYGFERVCDSTW